MQRGREEQQRRRAARWMEQQQQQQQRRTAAEHPSTKQQRIMPESNEKQVHERMQSTHLDGTSSVGWMKRVAASRQQCSPHASSVSCPRTRYPCCVVGRCERESRHRLKGKGATALQPLLSSSQRSAQRSAPTRSKDTRDTGTQKGGRHMAGTEMVSYLL